MPARVGDKVVVLTGAAGGQGAAEAAWLVRERAHVVATDVAAETPAAPAGPGTYAYRRLDVSSEEAWGVLAAWVGEQHGRVDALVNNAGVTLRDRIETVSLADWNRVLAINVTGALLGIRALLPLMPRGASIVNVGSVAALTGHYPVAYTVSKWALRGLSRVASMELGPRGIRVNTIHPGYIETPMTASAPAAFAAANLAQTPLGRLGQPDDVAPLVGFLVSDESAYLSGTEIPVDGGFTAHGGAKSLSDAVPAGRSEDERPTESEANGRASTSELRSEIGPQPAKGERE